MGGFSDLCPELRTRRGSWCWEGDLKPQTGRKEEKGGRKKEGVKREGGNEGRQAGNGDSHTEKLSFNSHRVGYRRSLQGESQYLRTVWHQPLLTGIDARQGLGRVLGFQWSLSCAKS